jgi:hypothetical protein
MRRILGRVLFIVGWLLLLALAQASFNPTVGLLAVVACAVHIGLVLGHRRQPHTTLSLGAGLWLGRQVLTDPVRFLAQLLRRRQSPGQAETIGIEVHLFDRRRAAEIERRLRAALRQFARTWAPHPLPLDRVTVYAGAPTEGRRQVYEQWLPANDPKQQPSASLTVISLGLVDSAGRPLDDQQLVGALANNLAALIVDRHQRQRAAEATAPDLAAHPQTAARPSRLPADLVDQSSVDRDLAALMDHLLRQEGPLEPEHAPPFTTN